MALENERSCYYCAGMNTRTSSKGQHTRDAIIQRALELARRHGLDGLTIGGLAEAMGMSKSGVFAHFGSREDLQLAVLESATRAFTDAVFAPAIRQRRGLPRLRAIVTHMAQFYRDISTHGGCVVLSAATEFDDQPGVIRDRVIAYEQQMRREMVRAIQMAIDSGEVRPDTDPLQLDFQIHGLMLACHQHLRVLQDPQAITRALQGFEHLLQRCASVAPGEPAPTPTP